MCHSERAEARGQPAEVGSVLSLCGIWESGSGPVTCQQVPSAVSLTLSLTSGQPSLPQPPTCGDGTWDDFS